MKGNWLLFHVTVTAESGHTWTVKKRGEDFIVLNQKLYRVLGHKNKLTLPSTKKTSRWKGGVGVGGGGGEGGGGGGGEGGKWCRGYQKYMNELNDYDVWDLPFVRSFLTSDIISIGGGGGEGGSGREGGKEGEVEGVVVLEAVEEWGGGAGECFSFKGGELFECSKKEMLHDWRFVLRKRDGSVGFVPANKMKEVEGK